jgi:hypothetical protein
MESQNLEKIEEQVRQLLHQVRRGDAAAVARWYSFDSEARTLQPRKADIQYAIARKHGFKSWQGLKDRLNKASLRSSAIGTPRLI